MEVGLSPGDFVLDGDWGSPPLKGHSPPQFSAMSVVAKRLDGLRWHLVWVGLGPSDFVFDGTQLPPQQRAHNHPVFGPCLLWPNGWMDEDATWYGSRPRPCYIVLVGVRALRETGTAAPIFSVRVYCGHGRPSQLLLSSCSKNIVFCAMSATQYFWKNKIML